ncbi:hypothetical protein V512_002505 [Mesotoga sp. Brook.08.105.5.1]|nr:hypothetical protein V512_002505 [Mesotoga sp. Brook.08.105.5.1]RAO97830.1 hypothetical protein M388_08955 [Mesotoga sp. Brook.08.YT.4.2.5.4.]
MIPEKRKSKTNSHTYSKKNRMEKFRGLLAKGLLMKESNLFRTDEDL